ncbi:facilitated trehalose transporter Tret1-like [Cylas formicarius]|uniref:facilitated trehalose transporter Tret1-like n=1 Tax=Cylas formicarius TaxID=197179 RepID=UPI00295847C9|nr:facilitated trehalose transporter Tret1-like [Cylas formicarius]XP_060534860.1 facilitated trehalose transporter Tret1-like [Cylas formicarius]XP_060534861.1 facilitated trehalose transporter Tret1-like [Cylas formicarius]
MFFFGSRGVLKINEDASPLYQFVATVAGCLGVISGAMHFGWPSPSLPHLLSPNSTIPISDEDGSWLAAMPCIGAASGSLLTAYAVDRIGRKTCMLMTAPGYFAAWLMVAFATTKWELYAARFISGAADGLVFTAFPMYLGEIASYDIRGLLGSSLQLSMIAGMLVINVLGSYLSIYHTALVSAVLPPIFFVAFGLMPESPYYLVMKGREEDAADSLRLFRRTADVSAELARVSEAVKAELEQSGRVVDLVKIPSNRKAVLIVFGLRTIQQLSGTTAIMFYAKTIFHQASGGVSPSVATIIYFSLQLVVALAGSFLVDKLGRKPLLVVSIIGSGLALSLEGVYFYLAQNTTLDVSSLKTVPLIALLAYVVVFNVGMGTIPVLLLGEMFPTGVKAFALCLADIWFGIIVTLTSKGFQIIKDDFGIAVPFFGFAACCVVGLVFIVWVVPETKGKTLENIQDELKGAAGKKHAEGDA